MHGRSNVNELPARDTREAAPQTAEPNQLAFLTRMKKLDSEDMTCADEGF